MPWRPGFRALGALLESLEDLTRGGEQLLAEAEQVLRVAQRTRHLPGGVGNLVRHGCRFLPGVRDLPAGISHDLVGHLLGSAEDAVHPLLGLGGLAGGLALGSDGLLGRRRWL